MMLTKVKVGQKVRVRNISGNKKTKDFLFTLGCHEGKEITLISVLAGNYVVNIRDSRYAIDEKMARSIEVCQ